MEKHFESIQKLISQIGNQNWEAMDYGCELHFTSLSKVAMSVVVEYAEKNNLSYNVIENDDDENIVMIFGE